MNFLVEELWKYNQIYETIPQVIIPDTLIYKKGKLHWYFMNKQGKVKRKYGFNINKQSIMEQFTDYTHCKIKATKYTTQAINYQVLVEYLDSNQLMEVIQEFEEDKINYVQYPVIIVQKFIFPLSADKNHLISALLTHDFIQIEKRVNIHKFRQDNERFYQELVTFEGPEQLNRIESIPSQSVVKSIENLMKELQRILLKNYYNKIQFRKLRFFFKSYESKVYSLFITERDVNNLNLTKRGLQNYQYNLVIPSQIHKTLQIQKINKDILCVACHETETQENIKQITKRALDKLQSSVQHQKFIMNKDNPSNDQFTRDNSKTSLSTIQAISEHHQHQNQHQNILNSTNNSFSIQKNKAGIYDLVKICEQCFKIFVSLNIQEQEIIQNQTIINSKRQSSFDNSRYKSINHSRPITALMAIQRDIKTPQSIYSVQKKSLKHFLPQQISGVTTTNHKLSPTELNTTITSKRNKSSSSREKGGDLDMPIIRLPNRIKNKLNDALELQYK